MDNSWGSIGLGNSTGSFLRLGASGAEVEESLSLAKVLCSPRQIKAEYSPDENLEEFCDLINAHYEDVSTNQGYTKTVPESIRELLKETTFAKNQDEVIHALGRCEKKILWQPKVGVLFEWSLAENNVYNFKVISSHPRDRIGLLFSGGKISWIHGFLNYFSGKSEKIKNFLNLLIFGGPVAQSEWVTRGMKNKIEPVLITFEKIPSDYFSKEWFELLKKSDVQDSRDKNAFIQNLSTVLNPFKDFRTYIDLPKLSDEIGYLKRFKTGAYDKCSSFWVYKAWIQENVDREDYKKFYFLERFRLIRSKEIQGKEKIEAAKKLIRSLNKNNFSLEVEEKRIFEKSLLYYTKKPAVSESSVSPELISLSPQFSQTRNTYIDPTEAVTPHQPDYFNVELEAHLAAAYPLAPNRGIDSFRVPKAEVKRELNYQFSSPVTQSIERLKEEKMKYSEDVWELFGMNNDLAHFHTFFDEQSYIAFKESIKKFMPKKSFDDATVFNLEQTPKNYHIIKQNLQLEQIFLKKFKELHPEEAEPEKILDDLLKKYFKIDKGSIEKEYYKFLRFLVNFSCSIGSFFSGFKIEDLKSANHPYYIFSSTMTDTRVGDRLSRISCEEAMQFFKSLHPKRKYSSKKAFEGFIKSFFSMSSAGESSSTYEKITKGKLPWVELLNTETGRKAVEEFIRDEFDKCQKDENFSSNEDFIFDLICFSSVLKKACDEIELPDFEDLFKQYIKVLQIKINGQNIYHYEEDRYNSKLDKLRLALFTLYGKQEYLVAFDSQLRSKSSFHEFVKNIFIEKINALEGDTIEFRRSRVLAFSTRNVYSPQVLGHKMFLKSVFSEIFTEKSGVYTSKSFKLIFKEGDGQFYLTHPISLVGKLIRGDDGLIEVVAECARSGYDFSKCVVIETKENKLTLVEGLEKKYEIDIQTKELISLNDVEKEAIDSDEEILQNLMIQVNLSNRDDAKKALMELPLVKHKLSEGVIKNIQALLASITKKFSEGASFDEIGLYLQIAERVFSWLTYPGREKDQDLLKMLSGLFNFFNQIKQNTSTHLLLTKEQEDYLIKIQENLLKKGFCDEIDSAIPPVLESSWLGKKIINWLKDVRFAKLTCKSNVYKRQFSLLDDNSMTNFSLLKFEWGALKGRTYHDDSLHNSCRRVSAICRHFIQRFFGYRKPLNERIAYFKSYQTFNDMCPTQKLEGKDKIVAKSKLYEVRINNKDEDDLVYTLDLIDFAINKNILKDSNESFESYIAKVEQIRFTKFSFKTVTVLVLNITGFVVGGIFNAVIQLLGLLISVYKAGKFYVSVSKFKPKATQFEVDSSRSPFAIFGKEFELTGKKSVDCFFERALQIANTMSHERDLKIQSGHGEKIRHSHLEGLFVRGRMQELKKLNPLLTDQDIHFIDTHLHEFYLAKLNIQVHSRDLTSSYDRFDLTSNLTRAALVFESLVQTNDKAPIRLRQEQIEKLGVLLKTDANGQYRNVAMQMEMGGGKTSVLTSIAMLQAAKPGRISMFVPPEAQFDTLAKQLTRWQKERFNQEVIPLKIPFSSFQDEEEMDWLIQRIKVAKVDGHALLVHPQTIYYLQIALMSNDADPAILDKLLEIRKEFKENTDVLIDELDLSLDPMKDTSMALGRTNQPTKYMLDHFRELMEWHLEDEKIRSALLENRPENLSKDEYLAFVQDAITTKLLVKFNIGPRFKESLGRFLLGDATQKDDKDFMKFLAKHENRDEISIYRHWVEDVLSFTIFRERGRHYGRNGDANAIVPYNGVASPAKTKFALLAEEMSYYYLTALSAPYTINQLAFVIDEFKERINSAQDRGKKDQIPEIKDEFRLIFDESDRPSFDLDNMESNPHFISDLLSLINKNPKYRLRLESYIARSEIKFYKSQVTATSQDFLTMFSTHRGFSGTFPAFVSGFDHEVLTDDSDARVEAAMKEHNESIEKVDSHDLSKFFSDQVEGDRALLNGLIDTGALFRNYSNKEVAKMVLDQLDYINDVIFFGKAHKDDDAPDTPYMMRRKGRSFEIIKIGATTKDVLDQYGVNLDTLFVYYDQRHTEATDVVQKDNARNVCTIGLKTTKRDLYQGIMRLRKYKLQGVHQEVNFVIDSKVRETLFVGSDLKAEKLIDVVTIIQEREDQKRSFKTFFHRIDAAFNDAIFDLLEKHKDDEKKVEKLKKFFEKYCVNPSAYEQFAALTTSEDSKLHLLKYIESKCKFFKKNTGFLMIPKELSKVLKEIKVAIDKTTTFQEKVKTKAEGSLGQEQTQQKEVQQEQQKEVEQESLLPREAEERGRSFEYKVKPKILALSDHYTSRSSLSLVSKKYDADLFRGLNATENWLHALDKKHKINHPYQLRAEYLLLEKKQIDTPSGQQIQLVPTLLSPYDYDLYKKGVKSLSPYSVIGFAKPDEEGNFNALLKFEGGDEDDLITEDDNSSLTSVYKQVAFINADISYLKAEIGRGKIHLKDKDILFLRKRIMFWHYRSKYDYESYDLANLEYNEIDKFLKTSFASVRENSLYPQMM